VITPSIERGLTLALKFSRKEQTYIPKWAENNECPASEQISFNYKLLTVEDMFSVQRETKVNLFGGMEIDTKDPESFESYWRLLKEIVTKYTSDWKNVIVDDAEIVDGASVLEVLRADHMDLINEVFNHIVGQSTGTEDEQKNLESESEATSLDSDLAAQSALETESKKKETAAEATAT
jgi:hypothetical protein